MIKDYEFTIVVTIPAGNPVEAKRKLDRLVPLSYRNLGWKVAADDPGGHVVMSVTHGQESALALFLETWAELLPALPDDYACHLTCMEADAASGLFRAFGYPLTADAIEAAHLAHDTPEDAHQAADAREMAGG